MEHETKASSSGGRHGSHKHKKKKQMPLALKIILLAVLVLLLAGAVWGLHFYQEITSPESLFEPQTTPSPAPVETPAAPAPYGYGGAYAQPYPRSGRGIAQRSGSGFYEEPGEYPFAGHR